MSLYGKLQTLSTSLLQDGSKLRPLVQMLIADIQSEAKKTQSEVKDEHVITACKRTLKRLEEISELNELDAHFKSLILMYIPTILSEEQVSTFIEGFPHSDLHSVKDYMNLIDVVSRQDNVTVDKKLAIIYIQKHLSKKK